MLKTIIDKELKRIFSDRRMVFSVFLLPALSIFLIYNLMGILASNRINEIKEHQARVAVVRAPESFQNFWAGYEEKEKYDLSYDTQISAELKEMVRSGEVEAIVEFPADFGEKMTAYERETTPDIHIYYNPTEDYSATANQQLQTSLLKNYQDALLQERFGDLKKIRAFTTNEDFKNKPQEYEIKNEKKSSGFGIAQLLPMMLSIMLFASAMGIGLETIAGEKERGTMAALLLTPVSRNTIALGKMISLGILAIISTLTSVIALVAAFPKLAAISGTMPTNLMYGMTDYLQISVILLLEVGIFVGMICLISVLSRTVKEASTYVTPAYMVVMMGAFAAMFSFGKPGLYVFAIPVAGNIFALKSALNFELTLSQLLLTCVVSLISIALLVLATAKAFKSEKIMFNA
ncbi:hypothetical protein C3V36_08445 [Lachnospiraceae bacterium oral taxon 500]|nr:hypothetical protein C3V36_08445 [Lachnospiraceae bacterium oral taxon 500]